MNLTATAENGRARIELKGTISKWRETEAEFTSKIEQLIRSGIKDVHIYINSPGGECFEANEIVNVIKKFPGKITGEGGALVASAATYIAINCTSFSMPANGLFMIHQVSGGACGRVADIESECLPVKVHGQEENPGRLGEGRLLDERAGSEGKRLCDGSYRQGKSR